VSDTSVSTSGSPRPAGRRCRTVTRSPRAAKAKRHAPPQHPGGPGDQHPHARGSLRPADPGAGKHSSGPTGEARTVDLRGVTDVHLEGIEPSTPQPKADLRRLVRIGRVRRLLVRGGWMRSARRWRPVAGCPAGRRQPARPRSPACRASMRCSAPTGVSGPLAVVIT
jgi:hypothetical protein